MRLVEIARVMSMANTKFWFFNWSKDAMQQPNRVIPKREKGGTEQSTRQSKSARCCAGLGQLERKDLFEAGRNLLRVWIGLTKT